MNSRIQYIDVAKGILILMMVCCHFTDVGSNVGVKVGTCLALDACEGTWAPFFMAAFFCITGMCSGFEGGAARFLLKNAKQILLPALTLGILTAVLNWAFHFCKQPFPITTLSELVDNLTKFWFLNALFISKILLFLAKKFTGRLLPATCLLLYLLGCLAHIYEAPNTLSFQQALIFLPFLYLGTILKNRQDLLHAKWLCLAPYPCIFIAACLLDYHLPGAWAIIHISAVDILPHLVIVPAGILLVLFLARNFSPCRPLELCGKYSLFIYCVHIVFLRRFLELFYVYCPINNTTVAILFIFLFPCTAALCVLIGKLFSLPFLRFAVGKF